jgi:hypothetical protein
MLFIWTTDHQVVTPADAGVHFDFISQINSKLDSSFRWNDDTEA